MLITTFPDMLEESSIVEDEYAAPSDIAWRITEIAYMKQASSGQEYYQDCLWLYRNIDHLLMVEGGGV